MITKQFAVLHVEKGSSNSSRLGAHIDRSFTPKNADPEKADLNEHHIYTGHTLKQDVDQRLKEAGCKIRSNSVKSINIVTSGSHERMKELEKHPDLFREWVNYNKKFLEKRYGKENIMRFAVHRDERTPHIHCVVTPITKDGRLSAKEVVGNKKDLQQLQEDYGQAMNVFGLNRGVKGSKARHDSIAEYYARINDPLAAEISIPEKKLLESKVEYQERVKQAILPLKFNLEKLHKDNKGYKQFWNNLIEGNKKLEKDRATFGHEIKIEKEKLVHEKEQIKEETFISTYERAISRANELLIDQGIDFAFKLDMKKRTINTIIPSEETAKQQKQRKEERERKIDRGPKLS